jgi:curved DNA-binding protein CbpA
MAVTYDPKCDYYRLLKLDPSCTRQQVRAVYVAGIRKVHPDVNQHPLAEAASKVLNEAWRILSDPRLRAEYDAARQEWWRLAQQIAARRAVVAVVRHPPAIRRSRRL